MTSGENFRPRLCEDRRRRLGQAQDFERPGAVRQAADEAALLERQDQPMDARLRAQVERLLHLVEGGAARRSPSGVR